MIIKHETEKGNEWKIEIRATKIGGSHYILVPAEFMNKHNIDNYVWYTEISRDGKTMTYRRMREDEKKLKEKKDV